MIDPTMNPTDFFGRIEPIRERNIGVTPIEYIQPNATMAEQHTLSLNRGILFLAFFRQIFMKYIESDGSSSKTITPLSKMGKLQANLILLLWDETQIYVPKPLNYHLMKR